MLRKLLAASLLLAVPAVAPAQSAEKKVSGNKAEKLVCRKSEDTGSLVKKKRICLTRAQWQQSAEQHQQYGRDLQDGLRGKPGGGGQ